MVHCIYLCNPKGNCQEVKTLDKYEYSLKLDEIKKLVTSGNYEEAVKVADTVEWKRVRNTRTLCMVSEIYEANDRLEDSKEILLRAYRRSQTTRTILFRLTEVAIKMKEFDEAVEYYSEFVNAAPNDTSRYILKYEIYKGRGSSLEDQISILEEYKEAEYTEQWGYELAKLYYQAGEKQKCIESCDDLVLWFRQGKYVIKALELKRSLTDLTPVQQAIYDHRDEMMPIKERVEAAVPELEKIIVDKMPSNETDAITENIISETQKELAQAVSQHTAAAEQEVLEPVQDQSWRYATGGTTRVMPTDAVKETLQQENTTAAPDAAFDAQQLQKELAESMREIISGIHPAETEAEIVEPKNDMSFFEDRAADVSVEQPKESIDDILVSMSGADEAASTAEQEEPEKEIPEMPVMPEQPVEPVKTVVENPNLRPQMQNSGTAASGFAALEAQAAKMRAEAQQAAGLNEQLAARAGVDRDKEGSGQWRRPANRETDTAAAECRPAHAGTGTAADECWSTRAGTGTAADGRRPAHAGNGTAAAERQSTHAGNGSTAAERWPAHAGNGAAAAERWPAHAGNGAAASRNEWPAAAASPEQCKSGPGCDPYGARRQKCRAGSGPAESLPAGSIPASSEPDLKPAADVLLFLHNSGTSGANRFRTE